MMDMDTSRLPAATPGAEDRAAPGRGAAPGATAAPTGLTTPIRVLIVDDKLIVREGVRAFLEKQSGFEVVAQAASLDEARSFEIVPDVVITDLVLPDGRGREIVVGLQSCFTRAAIFVLTDIDQRGQVEQIIASGAGGYVLKTATADEFLVGLRTAAQGLQYLQSSLRAAIGVPPGPDESSVDDLSGPASAVGALTTKERDVLRLLVLGHTNAEIARLCEVSLRTVEARRARVLQKLGVRTRAELVRVANRIGDIDLT